ncbi:phytoene synthase [gamma proteobacterium HTCC5015]|nr:phytoene synthase [gamma proteobacterium HTCC5015]
MTATISLAQARAYCLDKTKSSGSSFYHSFRFLPEEQRLGMIALYAFCREVDDVVDETLDEQQARSELDEWRQRVDDLYNGRADHPVCIALKDDLQRFNLHREHLLELIDGMAMDLDQNEYANFSELALYCYRAASVVGLLTVEIFGYRDRGTLQYAHDLGMAFQLTNILRDVGEDAKRGRIYLPQDELQRFGVAKAHLHLNHTTPEAQKLFAYQAERAERYYQKAFATLPEGDRYAQRSGLIMAAVYHRLLQHIGQRDFRILEQRPSLSKWRKIRIAWTAARAEKKRYRQFLKHKAHE